MEAREPGAFGVLLRKHRAQVGLTQEELAERAGLSARVVSDLERGVTRTPQRHTVQCLADALNLMGVDRAAFRGSARRKPSSIAAGRPIAVSAGPRTNLPLQPTPFMAREDNILEVASPP